MPSEERAVFIRTADGHKSYKLALDPRLSTGDWETRILQQGFHEPETGKTIAPHSIQAVSVKKLATEHPSHMNSPSLNIQGEMAGAAPVDWLLDQVQEMCALGLQ